MQQITSFDNKAPPASFGSRFQSRRPPAPVSEDEGSFSSIPSRRPSGAQAVPRRPVAAQRPNPQPSTFDNFEPQRQQTTGGQRQRLEVTEIKVRPQLGQTFQVEEPLDIDAFRQVAQRFRQRGQSQFE